MTTKKLQSIIENKENTQTQMINVNDIIVDESKRLRSAGDIKPIKDSIEALGDLIHPIIIDADNNLVAGYHRLLAYKDLGKSEIPARIIDKNTNKELVEIDENLIRNNLTTLETAQQLQKRKVIYEEIYPDSKAESIKRNNFASVYSIKSFTKDMSEKTEKSQRWVQAHLQIAEHLTSESVEKIKGTAIENNFIILQNIAKKESQEQLKAIESYLTSKEATKKELRPLNIKYKVDFRLRRVVVNNKWFQLPEDYDMDKNSYNQMVIDMKNLSGNY